MSTQQTCGFVLAILAGFIPTAWAADGPELDPKLPYQSRLTNPVTYEVEFSAIVTAPYHTKTLKVWLPLPQTEVGQKVEELELTSFPIEVRPQVGVEPVHGNKFAYFEFDHPQGAQIIRHRFKITAWELRWDLDPVKVTQVEKWPSPFDPYLKSDRAVVVNERFQKQAAEIVPRSRGAAGDLASVMSWVNQFMTYDHAHASLQASSEFALDNKRGHCSDYHGLCAALGRSLGYPTRVTYGINAFPKNSPSHCKLEAYLPPYGWVSFDVSETQRLIAAIGKSPDLSAAHKTELTRAATERLERGFRDNTWFVQTKGTGYDLVPPAAKPVSVVRTIYAEADGAALAEPDPANGEKREFSWMTAHKYTPDKPVSYPFADWKSLETPR